MHETVRLNVDPNHEHVHWAPPTRLRFAIGERVRCLNGFAGKITGRCWMSETKGLPLGEPDGLVVKVTHVPEGQERYLGWELAARPTHLEHLD